MESSYPTLRHYFQDFHGGKRLLNADDVGEMWRLLLSADTDITGPSQLKSYINEVTAGSEVTMPPAVAGTSLVIVNETPSALTVKAGRGDQFLDELGLPAPQMYQAKSAAGIYFCSDKGVWKQLVSTITSAMTEAPLDGRVYSRQGSTSSWVPWSVSPVTFGDNDGFTKMLDVILIDGGTY